MSSYTHPSARLSFRVKVADTPRIGILQSWKLLEALSTRAAQRRNDIHITWDTAILGLHICVEFAQYTKVSQVSGRDDGELTNLPRNGALHPLLPMQNA